jgi:hypothetical protein
MLKLLIATLPLLLIGCGTAVKPMTSKTLEVVASTQDVRLFNNSSWFISKGQRFEVVKMDGGQRVVFLTKDTVLMVSAETGVVLDERNCSTDHHATRDYTGIFIHGPRAVSTYPLDIRTSTPYPFCFNKTE